MGADDATERRALWKHYSALVAAISTTYALLVGVVFVVAPDLVVPVAIGGALVVGLVSSHLVRRTSRRDPLTER